MQQMDINTKFQLFIYSPRYSHAVGSKTNKKRKAKAYAVILHNKTLICILWWSPCETNFLVLKDSEI